MRMNIWSIPSSLNLYHKTSMVNSKEISLLWNISAGVGSMQIKALLIVSIYNES